MKKVAKVLLLIFCIAIVMFSGFFLYCFLITSGTNLDEKKLVNLDNRTVYYDCIGNKIEEDYKGVSVTDIKTLPSYVKNAFIAIEDKRFYKHHGVDARAMARALFSDIMSFSFKEGASTISQQLIKNTHLSGEKTFKRKILEIKLAVQLENKYTKDEILEKYLNTIYFGNGSYGISEAAENYFNKSAKDLSLSEAALLAGMIKAPSKYSPFADVKKCTERRNLVLKEMLSQGFISSCEYEKTINYNVAVDEKDKLYDYFYLARNEADKILENKSKYGSGYKIFTYFDGELQKNLESTISKEKVGHDYTSVITDNASHVKAFVSTMGDKERQIGSTIKPILVYAPAIEYDYISPLTPLLDEKTDFNGYAPSNYNNKYYGYVSTEFSLAKSLNVCAVKIFNGVGIDKCKKFAEKAGIPLTENDNSLNVALGCTEKGVKITELIAAYNVFSGCGNYSPSACVYKITDKNGNTIYKNPNNIKKICSENTAFLINDMLKKTVSMGTAKNLYNEKYTLCAKTGTVGNDKGNTDALTISYSPEFTLGVWIGNADGSYMGNSITGGTLPAIISDKIWQKINEKYQIGVFTKPDGISEVKLDKISYEKENKIVAADENFPKRYVISGFFKKSNVPKEVSKRFSIPTVESGKISQNKKGILIELCLTELVEAKIYRIKNGEKTFIYDTCNGKKSFLDEEVINGESYYYSVIPYYDFGESTKDGEEIFFDKVKFNADGDWWIEDFL